MAPIPFFFIKISEKCQVRIELAVYLAFSPQRADTVLLVGRNSFVD
jgi:hypothetical protein